MIGVVMLLSFLAPLVAALMIRRYAWIGACAALSAIVAVPVIYKLVTRTFDPMGWGFALLLVFWPAAAGVMLGALVTAFRRARAGPGELKVLNVGLAVLLSVMSAGFALLVASDF
ncbi:MAG: hypothetical protein AAFY82_00875 [Pseudomonadota bacterium]